MYRIETSLHLFVSWQLVGHFIPDLIKVWIVTDVPTMLQLCAHIVCSVSDTIQVLAAAFDGFEKYLAAFCLLPFLSTTKKGREKAVCIWLLPFSMWQTINTWFRFPFILTSHYHVFSHDLLRLASAAASLLIHSFSHSSLPMCLGKR